MTYGKGLVLLRVRRQVPDCNVLSCRELRGFSEARRLAVREIGVISESVLGAFA